MLSYSIVFANYAIGLRRDYQSFRHNYSRYSIVFRFLSSDRSVVPYDPSGFIPYSWRGNLSIAHAATEISQKSHEKIA